jgi:outer membrane receptor for ferrienterochelin and colicins
MSAILLGRRFAALAFLALSPALAQAQNGTLRGRVVDAKGSGVSDVLIQASHSEGRTLAAMSAASGEYSLSLPAGTYTVVARRLGFSQQRIPGVIITADATRELNITMADAATVLNQVVVTATPAAGGGEKVLDAPAHIGVVSELEVRERAGALTVADHIKSQPGVDVSTGGLVQSNIVSRGFNNAFSGSMLMLQDNRFTSVPSLRLNAPFLFTSTNEDIERIEVLLGPAAALYGPNSANGVLHLITKSPFTSQGGIVTVDAGERSVMRAAARYAGVVGEKFGYKLSGEIMTGKDWEYRDPAEPDSVLRPIGTVTAGVADRDYFCRNGQRRTVAPCAPGNPRDFDVQKNAAEARLDFRPIRDMEWNNTLGWSRAAKFIEITGANGAAFGRNWDYTSVQSRLRYKRTFAQIFLNTSNSGSADSLDREGTYLLRTGNPIVDNSRVLTAQLQQAFDLGEKQTFVIGGDYIATDPRTGGTINGRNEDIDEVTEVGGYIHSTSRLHPKLDLVAALRMDSHSEQEDPFFSPRAAFVYKATETQNVRLTYNRAFSTPANFSFFLDLPQGRIPLSATTSYTIRALGVPETGFIYPTGSSGIGGLYMRSPFPVLAPNPTATPTFLPQARIDANASQFYRTLVAGNQTAFVNALLAAGVSPSNVAQVFGALLGTTGPTPTQVGTVLRLFNPSGVGTPAGPFATVMSPTDLQPVAPLKSTLSSTIELGYKGIVGERLRLAVNLWYEQKENFTTPAVSVTPNLFMNPTQLGGYIGAILAAEAAAGRVPAGAVAPLATTFTTSLAQVPVGTIMLEQPGVSPDAGLTNRSDLIFTYRNVERTIDFYGTDMALDFLLSDRVTLLGTYGRVFNTVFPDVPSGVGPLRINAPQNKATLAAQYRDELSGFSGELRGRYFERFAVNSGVYVGDVPSALLFDLNLSYKLRQFAGASIGLAATNLLDDKSRTFVGVPEVGRLVLTRLQYAF